MMLMLHLALKEMQEGALSKKEAGEMYGDYGGLSEGAVFCVCRRCGLHGGSTKAQLAKRLFGDRNRWTGRLLQDVAKPVKDLLKLYFAFLREEHTPDQEAVRKLIERCGDLEDVIQIIKEDLDQSGSYAVRNCGLHCL